MTNMPRPTRAPKLDRRCRQSRLSPALAWSGRGPGGGRVRARERSAPRASSRVDAATTPRVGLKNFPQTLPLWDHEVVLTFDDGPWPPTTPKVLAALAEQCVQATFFLIGKPASEHPDLVRRIAAEGHTIGYHTWTHRSLMRIPPAEATEANRPRHLGG